MSEPMPNVLVRWWQRLWAPVCQDPDVILYGEYKGETVPLVPKVCESRPWLIAAWIPDPECVKYVDRRSQSGGTDILDTGDPLERRDDVPDMTGVPAAETPPDLPPTDTGPQDLNPAGQGGL